MTVASIVTKNRFRISLIGLLPVLLLLIYAITSWSEIITSCQRGQDQELFTLNVELAKQFRLFTGAYSNSLFRHPGPFYAYYLALGDVLLPAYWTQHSRFVFATLLFNGLIYGCCFLLLAFVYRAKISEIVFLSLLILACVSPESYLQFSSYWNPWIVPSAFMSFLLFAAVFASGSIHAVLPFLASASMALQSHVGTLPVISAISLFSFLFFIAGKSKDRVPPRRRVWSTILYSVTVCTAFWIPVLIDALSFKNLGNLGRLTQLVVRESEQARVVSEAFLFMMQFVERPLSSVFSDVPIACTISIFICLVTLPGIYWRQLSPIRRRLYILSVISIPITLYAVLHISERLMAYRISYFQSITVILYFLSGTLLWQLLVKKKQPRTIFCYKMGLVFFLGFLFYNVLPPRFESCSCKRMHDAHEYIVANNIASDTSYKILLTNNKKELRSANPFFIRLIQEKIDFCIDPELGYRFSDTLTCQYIDRARNDARKRKEIVFREKFDRNTCQRG